MKAGVTCSKSPMSALLAVIASQLSLPHWHATNSDPTLADAILDRVVHQALCLNLDGEPLRKKGKPG